MVDEEKIISKFITDVKSRVGWLVCVNKGHPVINHSWLLRNGLRLHEGYKAARILRGKDDGEEMFYKVICSIEKTALGLPLFRVKAYKRLNNETFSSDEAKNITSMKITTVSRQIINELNVETTHTWSGMKFFGLDRSDVQRLLKSSDTGVNKVIKRSSNEQARSVDVGEIMGAGEKDYCWLGIQSFGHIITGEFFDSFIKEHKGERYHHIRQGYISHMGVKCSTGEVRVITCRVSTFGPLPNYICESNDTSVKSECITTAVSQILGSVNAVTKRNWSGFEFFGFHRKDVFDVLKIHDRNTDTFEDERLQEILNIRLRNAGPTDNLKSKQAIDKRNSKIDSIVDYASFGDIKSIFLFFRYKSFLSFSPVIYRQIGKHESMEDKTNQLLTTYIFL